MQRNAELQVELKHMSEFAKAILPHALHCDEYIDSIVDCTNNPSKKKKKKKN